MDAPPGSCSFCGDKADAAHHLTGSGPDGNYLHPELTVDLCHRHHQYVHTTWCIQDIEQLPSELWTLPARLEIIQRRLAAFAMCQSGAADNPVWAALAELSIECADHLGFIDSDLDPATRNQ